ncbi:hypothetical protein GBZ26_05890 [Azospirillum formosense]|uniref:Uncharacterized protein n=2 Tax=Azospirillum formosense TaxID=861533 RepID=A0ABX2KYX8_9PROT|nr:hypothetical protein [Azospirillum formosense]MBY3757696.1 hypothetical protein [Azospirillum formosense]MBY3757748.1 hypothetical protein [Azospirillum formosense]NUB18748.1 hypothetical protein [Azospirillum formosense]
MHSADASGFGQWWNLVAELFESYLNYNYLLSNQIPLNKPIRGNQTPLSRNQIPVNRLDWLETLSPTGRGMKCESDRLLQLGGGNVNRHGLSTPIGIVTY